MKKALSLIIIASSLFVSFDVSAQMSKKEAKEWKKRLKKLTPAKYKQLVDQNKSMQSQVSNLKSELNKADDKLDEKDEQISSYQSQVGELRQELARAQTPKPVKQIIQSTPKNPDDKGVVFKVQIGAFTNKDLSKYLDNARNFNGEEEDGVRKYTIGVFRDYWEADSFKKYLREMGVKDAWIVSYRDGSRVRIKEVLGQVSRPEKS